MKRFYFLLFTMIVVFGMNTWGQNPSSLNRLPMNNRPIPRQALPPSQPLNTRIPSSAPSVTPAQPTPTSNSLNFEDEVIEGMNQNPFDALTQVGGKSNEQSERLYRKKNSFRPEVRKLTGEMGYQQ